MASLGVVVLPWGAASWSRWSWPVLAASALLGIWTLTHNRPGNFSIFPEPRVNAQLVVTGPYAFVRHPMYLAVLLFAFGFVLGWGGFVQLGALVVLAVVLHLKASREEALLAQRFPDYVEYAARTSRIVPLRWR